MSSEKNKRQQLLSVLSNTSLEDIQRYWSALSISPQYQCLKEPEIGMVMVKAKAGGTGNVFNMGEMTVTRSVVQLDDQSMGFGYTAGRNKKKSELIAVIDACFQQQNWVLQIEQGLLNPLSQLLQEKRRSHREKVDETKVNFFTMVRGE